MGVSVTRRIKQITQPKGGYLDPKLFKIDCLPITKELWKDENINPGLVGLVVDYLTRFSLTKDAFKSFKISLLGAIDGGYEKEAYRLINNIHFPLESNSIISATKLCGYDVIYRDGIESYRSIENILPNKKTIDNILEMINRSSNFFDKYGPMICDGFTFEKDGYTEMVDAGDGDFLTEDTLWDFKVSKNQLTSKQTLQLLMYWIMGLHSLKPQFQKIKKIGIYNPRLSRVYTYDLANLSRELIKKIEDNIICY